MGERARGRAAEAGGTLQGRKMRTGAYDQNVVYQSEVQNDSVGWGKDEFFRRLGDDRHPIAEPRLPGDRSPDASGNRGLEQVYILKNIEKGGLWAAHEIATKFGVGIAVRGTGTLAHMGIESGDPTKAQEFKNKTSKEVDLFLSDELEYRDLGSVVHFDPRVGWDSAQGTRDAARANVGKSWFQSLFGGEPKPHLRPLNLEQDWALKQKHIIEHRIPQMRKMPGTIKAMLPPETGDPKAWPGWGKVKSRFEQRVKEYLAEDAGYRKGGHYAAYVTLAGIHIRTQLAPDRTMVGDHDLFGFTDPTTHKFLPDTNPAVMEAQAALQRSNGFQAQHGGIWNWAPPENQMHIREVIMGAHGPGDDEPLVYFTTSRESPVVAAFYDSPDGVKSVWEYPENQRWYPYQIKS